MEDDHLGTGNAGRGPFESLLLVANFIFNVILAIFVPYSLCTGAVLGNRLGGKAVPALVLSEPQRDSLIIAFKILTFRPVC